MLQMKVLHISKRENKNEKKNCSGACRDRCAPEKKEELAQFVDRYNNAVSMVTGTVSSLESLNESIEAKIKEIDEYQAELTRTKDGLGETRSKNEKIIKNFKALIEA